MMDIHESIMTYYYLFVQYLHFVELKKRGKSSEISFTTWVSLNVCLDLNLIEGKKKYDSWCKKKGHKTSLTKNSKQLRCNEITEMITCPLQNTLEKFNKTFEENDVDSYQGKIRGILISCCMKSGIRTIKRFSFQ